ncbi:MAG: ABC transporter permease subunit [Clostridiales bacterium]|nr:ABC transporter permease subunit [Clostridiales bacterium]
MSKLLKYDDFLDYDEATGTYSMSQEQQVRDETERNRWKTTGFTLLKDWRLYLMLVPMIVVYIFWKYMPMYSLTGAFRIGIQENPTDRPWMGITAFQVILTGTKSADFWMAFRNTFVIAFYGLLFGFPTPIILAIFFNEVRSNIARSIMQVCVYLPKFLSTVIVTTLALTLFKGNDGGASSIGVISQLIGKISNAPILHGVEGVADFIPRLNQGLFYSSEYFRALYVITDLWEHAGYDSIVFFAAVIAISPTSYEAAQIDGAGKMAQMRYVVLPSILSTVIIMLIMKIGSLLSVGYEKIYLLSPDTAIGNYRVAEVVSTLSNRWASAPGDTKFNDQAFGMAAEMVNNLIGMILVIGSNTIARKVSDVSLY